MSEITSATGCYRVKREGGKGWHWVAPDRYDPKVHVLVDPLDHDADGKKGGAVKALPVEPDGTADANKYVIDSDEVEEVAAKPKRTRRKKAG